MADRVSKPDLADHLAGFIVFIVGTLLTLITVSTILFLAFDPRDPRLGRICQGRTPKTLTFEQKVLCRFHTGPPEPEYYEAPYRGLPTSETLCRIELGNSEYSHIVGWVGDPDNFTKHRDGSEHIQYTFDAGNGRYAILTLGFNTLGRFSRFQAWNMTVPPCWAPSLQGQ